MLIKSFLNHNKHEGQIKQTSPKISATSKRRGPTIDVEQLDSIDNVLKQMKWANMAFNVPDSLNLDDTGLVMLLLDLNKSIEKLKKEVYSEGLKLGAQIQISNRMQAELTGKNFDIVAIRPELQAITIDQPTEWKWELKALKPGRQQLHMTLTALLDVDGVPTPRAIKTFEQSIDVEVTWPQKMVNFLHDFWPWFWAALVVPTFGWIAGKKKKKERTDAVSESKVNNA